MGRNNRKEALACRNAEKMHGKNSSEFRAAARAMGATQQECMHQPRLRVANMDSAARYDVKAGDTISWCILCSKLLEVQKA